MTGSLGHQRHGQIATSDHFGGSDPKPCISVTSTRLAQRQRFCPIWYRAIYQLEIVPSTGDVGQTGTELRAQTASHPTASLLAVTMVAMFWFGAPANPLVLSHPILRNLRGSHVHAPLTLGCGSKSNSRGYAGFGPCFHLPGFHFGTSFWSH